MVQVDFIGTLKKEEKMAGGDFWSRGMPLVVLSFFIVSCASGGVPPEVAEVFGGGGGGSATRPSQSGAVAPAETCGQMAASTSAQFAGCYNQANWGEIPSSEGGGRCFTSSDCECCFLVVVPQIVEAPPVEEAPTPPTPTPVATPQQQQEQVGEKPPAGEGGGKVLVISRRIAVLITGVGLLLLALGSIFLEREVQSSPLWPLAEVLGAIFYGFVLGQLWLSQVTLPTLNLGWEIKILLVSASAGLGVFWSASEQAKSWQNTTGYFLLVLSGMLAWLVTGVGLPVVIR